jgi:hypothetical protein
MLVPLETLPGWPEAPAPSVLGTLALLVGFPALVSLIIVGIAKLRRPRSSPDQTGEPLWLRGEEPAGVAGTSGVPAIEARRAADSGGEGSERGGASARW